MLGVNSLFLVHYKHSSYPNNMTILSYTSNLCLKQTFFELEKANIKTGLIV